MEVPHQYRYDPLPHNQALRVLKLRPDPPTQSVINCEILVIRPDAPADAEGRKYEAISWFWGTGSEDREVRISNHNEVFVFRIREELYQALRSLRNERLTRYLWVDAICIIQSNIDEKNTQVPRMDQIYGDAEHVCIWLGMPSNTSTDTIKWIRDRLLKLWDFDGLCDDLDNAVRWKSLMDLMKRPWFSRRWIVQELALAKSATVYCGRDTIPWQEFANAVALFVEVESASRRLSEVIRKDNTFDHLPSFFGNAPNLGAARLVEITSSLFRTSLDGQKERRSSLENLVSRLNVFSSSDPRDTVYALLAMAKDSNPQIDLVQSDEALAAHLESLSANKKSMAKVSLEEGMRDTFLLRPWRDLLDTYTIARSRFDRAMRKMGLMPRANRPDIIMSFEEARELLELVKRRLKTPEQEPYKVNYHQSVLEVYQQFVAFALRRSDQTRALDILCRPWAPPIRNRDEWRYMEEKAQDGEMVPVCENRSPEELDREVAMPSWLPKVTGASHAMTDEHRINNHKGGQDFFTQGMKRINADSLAGMPDAPARSYSAAGTRTVNRKRLRFRKRRDHYSLYVEGFVLDEIATGYEPSQSGAIPRSWMRTFTWKNIKLGNPEAGWDAFWRTLVADRGPKGSNVPSFYELSCLEALRHDRASDTLDTTWLINFGKCTIVAEFLRRVQATIWARRLIQTREDRLGLVNRRAEDRDIVCILYGCSVPVILRRHGKLPSERERNQKDDELMLIVRIQKAFTTWKRHRDERRQSGSPPRRGNVPLIRQMYRYRHQIRIAWLMSIALYIRLGLRELHATKLPLIAMIHPALSLLPSESSTIGSWLGSFWTSWLRDDRLKIVVLTAILAAIATLPWGLEWVKLDRGMLWVALSSLLFYPDLLPTNVRSMVRDRWTQSQRLKQQKVQEKSNVNEDVYYEFMGEAYIHGMMNGEAIAWQNDNAVKAETFELR